MNFTINELYGYIQEEKTRQETHIELIASENFVSNDVLKVSGSILTNKYAEGYPNRRYYGGCEYVDKVESFAIEALKKIYGCEHANVQPHSGSQANACAYASILKPGETILGMSLDAGGHLTHGFALNFSGKVYNAIAYGLNDRDEIDYEQVRKLAHEHKPRVIVAGASAYPLIIDFKKFREIADEVGAYLMVDMAHIAGLVAAGVHPTPVPYADIVTSTTHKTLRGARGGIILCKAELAKAVDSAVFPGNQGGPLMHLIAGKAIAFVEALKPEFKIYQEQVVKNAKIMANEFLNRGYRVIGKGTQNHLVLIDVKSKYGITGKDAENLLHSINITCNKNSVPNDTERPMKTSGIRVGSPAMTTRGFKEKEFSQVVDIIDRALSCGNDEEILKKLKTKVQELTRKFPLNS
ncbi:MAG: serine hydroxymethyltransferase [Mycoplasma sp.]